MRWLRMLLALVRASLKNRLTIRDTSIIDFRVWLTDVDASIMNHAAIMTVFEVGRIDFIVRNGFFKLLRKKKWYFASGSMSVQFLRPLKLFQKADLTTRLFHVTDQWIYTEQKIVRNGKVIAICLVKSKAKKGKLDIHTDEILASLKETGKPVEAEELIDCFEKENSLLRDRFIQTDERFPY